MVQAGI